MHEDTGELLRSSKEGSSPVVWESLEGYARLKIQEFLQALLEEEVTDLLGRAKSQRRDPVDAPEGYRNGHGKPRQLATSIGTVTVQRPRVRGVEERFVSRVLPLFKRRTKEVGELLPRLYLHGLSQGDFEGAMRGLLGEAAPLSASSIARLKEKWQAEYAAWKERSLSGTEVVYLWVDGIYVKAGLESEKAALLVVIGALRDGTKVVLAVESGYRESVESWSAILRGLKARGMNGPSLVVGDGHLGIWGALSNVFPSAKEQRCWNHRIVNLLDKVSKKEQPTAASLLKAIPYAETREEAEARKRQFQSWCKSKGFEAAALLIEKDWERMTTFYSFPKEHWKHLRTTNVVESPFASVRLRTTAAKRFKKVGNATAMIWKLLLVAEQTFRKLDAPHLLEGV
ncbi:MAG: IS256 family transposase [Armatimonadetes bacterium]|nr:IS256 family transposase [Armatimonadota bacterium]